MRTLMTASLLGLVLAVGACSKADQQKTQADTQTATTDVKQTGEQAGQEVKADAAKLGADIKSSAEKGGKDLKSIAKDPQVKKAANDLKSSLKELGGAVKDASKKTRNEEADEAPKK